MTMPDLVQKLKSIDGLDPVIGIRPDFNEGALFLQENGVKKLSVDNDFQILSTNIIGTFFSSKFKSDIMNELDQIFDSGGTFQTFDDNTKLFVFQYQTVIRGSIYDVINQ
jgi:hypothetical protein